MTIQAAAPSTAPSRKTAPASVHSTAKGIPESLVRKLVPSAADDEVALMTEILNQMKRKFDRPKASRYKGIHGSVQQLAERAISAIPDLDPINVQAGPFYTTASLTKWLGVSRQYIHELSRQKRLLALTTADGYKVYPAWQFTRKGAPIADMPIFIDILERGLEPWTIALWFQTESGMLGGITPEKWVHSGRLGTQALAAAAAHIEIVTGEHVELCA